MTYYDRRRPVTNTSFAYKYIIQRDYSNLITRTIGLTQHAPACLFQIAEILFQICPTPLLVQSRANRLSTHHTHPIFPASPHCHNCRKSPSHCHFRSLITTHHAISFCSLICCFCSMYPISVHCSQSIFWSPQQ